MNNTALKHLHAGGPVNDVYYYRSNVYSNTNPPFIQYDYLFYRKHENMIRHNIHIRVYLAKLLIPTLINNSIDYERLNKNTPNIFILKKYRLDQYYRSPQVNRFMPHEHKVIKKYGANTKIKELLEYVHDI